MEESVSSVKAVKQSQSRGAKASSSQKSNREGAKSTLRSKENLAATKDERNAGSLMSRVPGGAAPDNPLDKKRGRPSRLTGRTSSGERGKAKVANAQPQLPESKTLHPADGTSGSSANREPSAPVLTVTPERALTERAKSSSGAPSREKPHGGFYTFTADSLPLLLKVRSQCAD